MKSKNSRVCQWPECSTEFFPENNQKSCDEHLYLCHVEGCWRRATGLHCPTHGSRYKSGRPLDGPIKPKGVNKMGTLNSQGYRVLSRTVNGYRYSIMAHRAVMEEHLGRELVKNENVHHINGNRSDNRIENLELWNTSQPAGQRVPDKVKYATEILALYSPDRLVPFYREK